MGFGAKRVVNGQVIPDRLPDEIGLGCPKHDAAFFVKGGAPQRELDAILKDFLMTHGRCGNLDVLEKWEGKTYHVGQIEKGSVVVKS